MTHLSYFISLLALALSAPNALGAGVMAITHVNVIDGSGTPLRTNMTLIIADERIRSLGQSTQLHPPADAVVLEAKGKFVIPGLWDMHVHWYESESLPLFIANGVTGIRMMHGVTEHHEWRSKIETGKILGPRMWIAGMVIDGPRPIWPGTLAVGTADEAVRTVTGIRKSGADFVKVYSLLPREAFLAVAEECHRQGIYFVGHVPALVSTREASERGQRSFEHLIGIALGCSAREAELISATRAVFTQWSWADEYSAKPISMPCWPKSRHFA
jgi:hypothetical protein